MTALEKVSVLFQELESLRPLSIEDEQRIMQKFRLDWNYHSNHLEGNQLTFGETKALILFNITAQGKPLKDHIEMTGHNEAIEWIIEVVKEEQPLTESFIRNLHKLLLKEPYEVDAITPDGKPTKKRVEVGKYKSTPNHVKTNTGEIFRFASPEETPAKMHDLLRWFRVEKDKEDKNAIILAAEFHYRFIRIHPFDDGNGRLARILMNFILMSFRHPPVVIKTEDKENYFSVLRLADTGQFEPFVTYIAENLCHSLELMIKGAKGEEIEEPDDLEKEIILLGQKINSLGNNKELTKSLENVRQFVKNSLTPLYDLYKRKMGVFDRFYSESKLTLSIQSNSLKGKKHLNLVDLSSALTNLNSDIRTEIWLSYMFNGPIHQNLEFDYTSNIAMVLNPFQIVIETASGGHLKLEYEEILSKEQIKKLVTGELIKHKNEIEVFIKKASSKN